MNLKKFITRNNGRNTRYTLVPLGDIHDGTRNCDETKLFETIDWIRKTPNCYWLGTGDYIEGINYTDVKRFDPKVLHPRYADCLSNLHYAQINHIGKILKPIAHKCIGLIEGNHEISVKKNYHTDVTDILAYKLKVDNLGYTTMIRWCMYRRNGNGNKEACNTIEIYATHGQGGGGMIGSKINKVMNIAKHFDADIYLMGHVHEKTGVDSERLVVSGGQELRLVAKKRIFALTGSFFKTYQVGSSSYGERAGYAPIATGVVKITIEPFRRKQVDGVMVEMPPHLHISE